MPAAHRSHQQHRAADHESGTRKASNEAGLPVTASSGRFQLANYQSNLNRPETIHDLRFPGPSLRSPISHSPLFPAFRLSSIARRLSSLRLHPSSFILRARLLPTPDSPLPTRMDA